MKLRTSLAVAAVVLVGGVLVGTPVQAGAQAAPAGPTMLDPSLTVRTVVSGLTTPTSIAFLGPSDLLVLEKNTGKVLRVTGGVVQGVVLDLSVNFASERGLLGIALHPTSPPTLASTCTGAAAARRRRPIRSSRTSSGAWTPTCPARTPATSCRCPCSATGSTGSSGTTPP